MVEIEYNLMLVEKVGKRDQQLDIGGDSVPLSRLEELVGLTDDDVGMLFINGKWAPLDSIIHDGDSVRLYPDTEGG